MAIISESDDSGVVQGRQYNLGLGFVSKGFGTRRHALTDASCAKLAPTHPEWKTH